MGAGAGKLFDSDDEGGVDGDKFDEENSTTSRRMRQRMAPTQRIFQRTESVIDSSTELSSSTEKYPEDVLEFLRSSLSGFFYLQNLDGSKEDSTNSKVELIIHLMKKENYKAGTPLIIEGEPGDKLFIVEDGELGVSIRGEAIRTIGRGALLGELALIYDCPRSATVMCKTDSTVYSLQRKLFKKVLTVSVDAAATQRSRWLLNSPELAIMSPMHLSRLVASLKPVTYQRGQYIYEEMNLTSQITLIERGVASVMTSMDLRGFAEDEIDKMFGILRPVGPKRRVKSVNEMNFSQLQSFLKKAEELSTTGDGQTFTDQQSTFDIMSRTESTLEIESANGEKKTFYEACKVYEGCLMGIAALRGKAGMPHGWRWVSESELSKKRLAPGEAAETPFTVEATETCDTLTFSVENFEALFGAINNVIEDKGAGNLSAIPELTQRTGFPFDMSRFKILSVLGSGSFGTVTLAEYTGQLSGSPDSKPSHTSRKNSSNSPRGGSHDPSSPTPAPLVAAGSTPRLYALKSLSKTAIVETGQLRHVIDEKNILFAMDDPFCLKLYGVYQTPHQIVMVTEAIESGDLWGVIYEEKLVSQSGGIPHDLVPLYACGIIYALDHIHSKFVVFRDLKPENIMIDCHGYPRVIDFGFAKRVPYQKVDEHGIMRIHAKTFTLCGTPEYLPPELIFNTGHDQMADLWSLGVVIYEMIMGRTPFAPRKPDNITELFTNIAMAKKNGLLLSTRIDDRAGKTPYARELITQLIKAEPTDRLGKESAGRTGGLLKHPYFSSNINVADVYQQTFKPSFIPQPSGRGGSATNLQPVKAYTGDQQLFASF